MGETFSELWVCFQPPVYDPSRETLILSFMAPEIEMKYEKRFPKNILSGRSIAQEIRPKAQNAYKWLFTYPPSIPCFFQKTLRELLKKKDGISRWWYSRLSVKDSVEINSPYNTLIQLYCIKSVAERNHISTITLFGANYVLAQCLKKNYHIILHKTKGGKVSNIYKQLFIIVKGFLGKFYFISYKLYLLHILKKKPSPKIKDYDVLLQAYWDWSLTPNNDELTDRYFTDLPAKLKEMKCSVGWLASFSPHYEKWQRNRSLKMVADLLDPYQHIIMMEHFMKSADVIRASLDMRYFFIWCMFTTSRKFKSLFMKDCLDLYPLFKDQFLYLFAGNEIQESELSSKAVERICKQYQPKAIITFLEFFLDSRALYAGARRVNQEIKIYTAQHAPYSSDKMFGFLDYDVEFNGQPDGCGVPVPDEIFSMGELSYKIWIQNGFHPERITQSGGLRYKHVKIHNIKKSRMSPSVITILLVAGMNENIDFEMCEAVYIATESDSSVKLKIRNHPSYWITDKACFSKFAQRITVSNEKDAYKDLSEADIVIFTHSSLPEEALLLGIPVWQWLWSGFNTSSFVDLPVIPTFTTIRQLKLALNQYIKDPDSFRPSDDLKQRVLCNIFGQNTGKASAIIAETVRKQLNGSQPKILTQLNISQ